MALPPDRVESYQGAPTRAAAGGGLLSYWLKEPAYMAKWTYFHRPSVWNAVGGPTGLTWHGLYGFKTLFAGAGGVSYTGGRRTVPPGMRWILQGGGRGLEAVGTGFTRLGGAMPARLGRVGRLTAPMYGRMGRTISRFGAAFRTGGIAGGLRGVGASKVGTVMEQVVGGATTSLGALRFPSISDDVLYRAAATIGAPGWTSISQPPSALLRSTVTGLGPAATSLVPELQRRIARQTGIGGLLRPSRYAGQVIGGLTPAQQVLFKATGKAGMSALNRGIMWRGGAQLMRSATVGLNILMVGGILSSLAYSGTRALGEAAFNMRLNQRVPALEFGRGINPFQTAGALTERQRAISAISESHLNARASIGSEARIVHERPY